MKPIINTKSLILFGDSLLGRFGKLYIDELESALKDVTIYNCATGGFNTEDGIKRVDFIAQLKPNYVILSFGANDCAPLKKQVSEKSFEQNLDYIIEAFPGSKVVIFLCPPAVNLIDWGDTDKFNTQLSKYNKIIRKVAERRKASIIDSEKIYGDLIEKGENYHLEDGIHLNETGNSIMIREIVSALSNQ